MIPIILTLLGGGFIVSVFQDFSKFEIFTKCEDGSIISRVNYNQDAYIQKGLFSQHFGSVFNQGIKLIQFNQYISEIQRQEITICLHKVDPSLEVEIKN